MKKIIVLLIVLALALTACGNGGAPAQPAPEQQTTPGQDAPATDENFTIGVAVFSMAAEFPATINAAITEYIAELGLSGTVTLLSVDAGADAATQVGQIETFIAQGVDGIILLPMDADALIPAVEAAYSANIPLVTCNGTVNSDLVTAHVGSLDVVAGELSMQYMAERIGGSGQIAILRGPSGISAEILRREGYENILRNFPDIEIVAEHAANWSRAEALTTTENLIMAFPDLVAIIAQNDEMAMGALEAIISAGREDDIIVGGIDAIPDALYAVRDGSLASTVFQDAVGQARGAVDVILMLVRGEAASDVDIPFILVTQDNVNNFM